MISENDISFDPTTNKFKYKNIYIKVDKDTFTDYRLNGIDIFKHISSIFEREIAHIRDVKIDEILKK